MSSSSSPLRAEERERGEREEESSSSSSDSDSSEYRRQKKKARKEEKKMKKKESKSKKEKKDKKDKKEKKEKKDRKEKDRRRSKESNGRDSNSNSNSSSSGHDNPPISEHDAIEMASFREAVQGKQALVANEREQASLLHASREDIAASLGLSKGLIRTTIDEKSDTQRYSRDLYGGDDDNPAKRQRLNRERVARRALEIARKTIEAKAAAAAAAKGDPSKPSSGLMDMMNRFSSSNKGISKTNIS